MKYPVVSVVNYDFIGTDGKPVKFNKVFVADERGNVGSVRTQKAVKTGDFVELKISINSKSEFKVSIA